MEVVKVEGDAFQGILLLNFTMPFRHGNVALKLF